MNSYGLKRLTLEDVSLVNGLADGSTIVFKNTTGIEKEAIARIKPSIKVRIIGGLDEREKPKYNTPKYYARTIYSPIEVYKILDKIESIERGIKPDWNDLDKAMFIYKTLCDGIKYDYVDNLINGRDYNRNLLGLLTGKSVCAGFSMIYKEMLDRQGIRCIYQNKQHGHAWNLIQINGRLIPVDLTFDVGVKEVEGKCKFNFFGMREDFFKDPNHMATGEQLYDTSLLTREEFNEAYEKVVNNRNVEEKPSFYTNSKAERIFYHIVPEGNYKRCIMYKNGIIKSVLYDETISDDLAIHSDYFSYPNEFFSFSTYKGRIDELNRLNSNCSCFYRKDGSSFMLRTSGEQKDDVIEHDYFSFDDSKLSINKLLSEDNLVLTPFGLREGVANILLSKSRVSEKTKRFKGYVGYIGIERGRFQKYYNSENERRISGIIR